MIPAGRLPTNPLFIGILFKLGSELAYVFLWIFTKLLGPDYPTGQVVFIRTLVAFLPLLVLMHIQGGWTRLRVNNLKGMVFRLALGCGSVFCAVYAVTRLPLATSAGLIYTIPIFTCIFGVMLLKERPRLGVWIAILAGFGGMLLILQPFGTAGVGFAGFVAVMQALLFALSLVMSKALLKSENSLAITFYANAMNCVIGAVTCLFAFQAIPMADWPVLFGLGVCAAFGLYLTTHAYTYASVSELAPYEYTGLLWSLMFGFLIWHEVPGPLMLLGAAVIVASGLYVTLGAVRAAKQG